MKTLLLLAFITPILALWPQPRNLQAGNSTLKLASNFRISSPSSAPSDLQAAIQRTTGFLHNDKLGRLIIGRGASDVPSLGRAKSLSSLTLSLTGKANSIASEAVKPIGTRDESYTLSVPSDGSSATLKANTTLGLLRGLATFEQLWYSVDGTTYAANTPVNVNDSPAYPYRGFMLDTSRNFFPVSDIKRTLDAMSWVKINTFHWHIVDAQSWPVQIPSFPELSAKGAYSSDMTYSASDVQSIVQYANERGIDVLPEFDTPGHTAVIVESHPEHIACAPGSAPYDDTIANEPPSGQLRFSVPATQTFTAAVIKSFSSLFPTSSLFSTGGDELNTKCLTNDGPFMAALNSSGRTFEQALSDFTVKSHAVLKGVNKTPVVWEEMVLANNVTLGNDTVVMVWISSDDAAAVAQKGFRLVHAPSDYFYLDCGGGGWLGNNPPGNSWCDPMKTWQKAYTFDPLANISSSASHLVLGGQQLLWTEQSGPENLDPIVWPRAAASAEVFWSGGGGDVKTALGRLHDLRFRMVQRGVKAINLQPLWCALRDGQCDLT